MKKRQAKPLPPRQWFSVRETAEIFGWHPRIVRLMLAAGAPCVAPRGYALGKRGNRNYFARINIDDFAAWAYAHPNAIDGKGIKLGFKTRASTATQEG